MFKLLQPDEVIKTWKYMKEGIKMALPPFEIEGDKALDLVLNSLIHGKRQAWVSFEEENKVKALVITDITGDDGFTSKNLLIYAIAGFYPLNDKDWEEGINTLHKFAKTNNCNKLIAYTNVQKVIDIAKQKLNADVEYVLLTWEV